MGRLRPTTLQPIAARIAAAICAADEAEVRALHAELAKLMPPEPEPPPSAGTRQSPDVDRIGIWGRESGADRSSYRRLDQHRSHWRLWADVDEVPATCPGRRIVWLGESAARGYFYDPVFAPAVVLQDLLRQAPALRDLEVVDLARSNIDPGGILEVAAQSVRLKPDLFVLFAGNNWCAPELYDAPARRRLKRGLGAGGYRGCVDVIDRWRAERTEANMVRFAAIAKSAGVPVIVVVPESNCWIGARTARGWSPFSRTIATADGAIWRAGRKLPSTAVNSPTPLGWPRS